MKSGEQLTIIQRDELIGKIMMGIIQGRHRFEMLPLVRKEHNISITTFDKHFKTAKENLKKIAKENSEYDLLMAKALARLENLYTINLKINNYVECRAIIKDMLQICGYSPSTKLEISGKDGKPIEVEHKEREIDYSKLSDSALLEIIKARKQE